MAKPVKSAVKTVSNVIEKVAEVPVKAVGAAAKAVTPEPTAQMAGQQLAAAKAAKAAKPVAPVTGPTRRVTPKSPVSLGGEDQMAATAATTRRRRAGGMQTRSRGLTGSARTQKKTLLGQ